MDPKQRFSGRVRDYARYRPGYPREVLRLLERSCGLTEDLVVADIGSGTGILSRLFLDNGNRVFGVEPNGEMRSAAERLLSGYERFASVAATAEETTLPESSADFVTAGQSFHWFDTHPARAEFARVLKTGGWAVLVWNSRRKTGTPFLEAYERLLGTFGTDYGEVEHGGRAGPQEIRSFFAPVPVREASFENRQVFDFDGLKGRLLSSSYVPVAGEPGYDGMVRELRRLVRKHERDGTVTLEYDTEVYYGHLAQG